MTQKLTKREALEICIMMWDYLAENPDATKGITVYTLGLPEDMDYNCAACEYCC